MECRGRTSRCNPGDAVWIKPQTTYPFDTISQVNADSGWLAFGNPDSPVNYANQYRLVTVSAQSLPNGFYGNAGTMCDFDEVRMEHVREHLLELAERLYR